MRVSVTRAAWRPVAYVLFAIPMVLLAVDMLAAHKWFPEPDHTLVTTAETPEGCTPGNDLSLLEPECAETIYKQLTPDGKAQQRRERAWGLALLAGGAAAAAWGLKDLLFPRRVLTLDGDYLALRVASRGTLERRYSWSEILDVRSGVLEDEAGPVPVLSLRFIDDSLIPPAPWGAVADPPWLHLYASEWDRQAHEVVPMLETHLLAHRRRGEPA